MFELLYKYVVMSILPSKQQVIKGVVKWNKQRINNWIADLITFFIVTIGTMVIKPIFIRDSPLDNGFVEILWEFFTHTVVVVPMIGGYIEIKNRIHDKICSFDPVKKIEELIKWYNGPTDPTWQKIAIASIPVTYILIFYFRDWIGYTLGGFVVHKTLTWSLQAIILIYSNLLHQAISTWWKGEKESLQEIYVSEVLQEDEMDNIDTSSLLVSEEESSLAHSQEIEDPFVETYSMNHQPSIENEDPFIEQPSTNDNKENENDSNRLLVFSMNPPNPEKKNGNVVKLTAKFENIIGNQK